MGNIALTTLGNSNINTAAGALNGAAVTGLPGSTVMVADPMLGTSTTTTTSAAGNDNSTTALGAGNTALTLLGNNNRTTAIGRQNLASTTGLFGISETNSLTGPIFNVPATGNNNKNIAIGSNSSATSLLLNNQKNIAIGHNQHKP